MFLRDEDYNIKMDKIIIDLACGYVNSAKLWLIVLELKKLWENCVVVLSFH
jgi:hypothetical protein